MASVGDYTEVLIPSEGKHIKEGEKSNNKKLYILSSSLPPPPPSDKNGQQQQWQNQALKWLGIFALLFTCSLTVITTVFVIHHQATITNVLDSVGNNKYRISEVEKDLDTFFTVLAEELDYDVSWRKKKAESQEEGKDQDLFEVNIISKDFSLD